MEMFLNIFITSFIGFVIGLGTGCSQRAVGPEDRSFEGIEIQGTRDIEDEELDEELSLSDALTGEIIEQDGCRYIFRHKSSRGRDFYTLVRDGRQTSDCKGFIYIQAREYDRRGSR